LLRVEYHDEAGQALEKSFPLNGEPDGLVGVLASGRVDAVHSTEASLDDIFVRVTGRSL
jgi:fluoroquinolone transport system ATP-binding protein